MATKVKTGVIDSSAITSALIANASITADDLHTTLDLTGKTVTVSTASAGDNDTSVASTAYVDVAIANLADSAPSTLNTLNELAAALGDDANFSTTVTNSIATKAPLASPNFTGQIQVSNAASTIQELTVTGNNTRSTLRLNSKDSSGNAVDLRMHSLGDGPRGEIFTFSNHPLAFATNNSAPQMTLDTSGNVGIGTTSPDAKLHVQGGDLLIQKGTGTTSVSELGFTNAFDTAFLRSSYTNPSLSTETYLAFHTNTSGATNSTVAEQMRIVGNKVGIGTATLGTNNKLTLYHGDDTSYAALALQSDHTSTGNSNGSWLGIDQTSAMGLYVWNYEAAPIRFGTSAVERMHIDSSGIVHIGSGTAINDANVKLQLNAPSGGEAGLGVNDNGAYALLLQYTSGTGARIRNIKSTPMLFETNGSERMRIDSSGKVGIGNTNPGDYSADANNLVVGSLTGNNGLTILSTGSSGYGSIYFADSITGNKVYAGFIRYQQNESNLTFGTNEAERMRIDVSGRVGINRTPSVSSSKLEIGGADGVRLVVVEASGHTGGIGIQGGTASNKGFLLMSGGQIKIQLSDQTNVSYTADGLFNANARPSRYKTSGSGQMVLGYQDNGSGLYSGAMGLEYDCVDGLSNTSYVGGFMMKDTASGTIHLRINTNGNIYNTNNIYTSISDSRIKSDIIDASSQWDDIKALRVRKYKLAHQPAPYNDQLQIGVIAQELESAGMNGLIDEIDPDEAQLNYAPELVGEKVKIVKYSILYMKAIKALQEAMTRIETLEARVTELES